MNKIKYILIALFSSLFIGNIAYSDGHSGSFSFHTGWYFDGNDMLLPLPNLSYQALKQFPLKFKHLFSFIDYEILGYFLYPIETFIFIII